MKSLEKVFIVFAIIGLLLRVMMLDWGELFLTVSLPSLAVLYLLTSWSIFKHKEDGHHLFLSLFTGLAFFITLMGILMKLMIWKWANITLGVGLSMMLVFKVMGLFLEKKLAQEMDSYFKKLFLRYYIIAGAAIIVLITPYKYIVTIYHRDDPEYIRLFLRYFEEPNNKKYKSEFLKHRRKVFKEKLKTEGDKTDHHDHNHNHNH
jgi:hypothetical protein